MINKTVIKIIISVLFALQINFAQTDSLISYDPLTQEIHVLSPGIIDSSKDFDNTGWDYGTESGFEYLSLIPPDSTFSGAGFTDYIPAQRFFSVDTYPARAAVKTFFVINDTLRQACSGMLVAQNYVLTDCHCLGSHDSTGNIIFNDSLYVFPAFDNGMENPVFGSSRGIQYFTFKSNLRKFNNVDIALIKLEEDIGSKTGWIGIAFSNYDSFYINKVFHKFSYPGTVDFFDSTRVYNGDTLYYNYGILDLVSDGWLGYNIYGIRGQSGSSLFYTDNNECYSFGTLVYSTSSQHLRITPEIFYAFKSIISSDVAEAEEDKDIITDYYLSEAYPNPFNPSTSIQYATSSRQYISLKVYDILGNEVATLVNEEKPAGNYTVSFNAAGLPSGVYFCKLIADSHAQTKKMMLLR